MSDDQIDPEPTGWPFHRLADIFPLMDEAGLAELADDIKAHGLREHIKLWKGEILDGRNRYLACGLAGVEPVLKAVEFPDGEPQALAYVLSRNLMRRHLSVPQRSLVAGRIAKLKRGNPLFGKIAELEETELSQARAAKMLNVSPRSVSDAKAVLDSGDADFIAEVEAGRTSLHEAAETARRERRPVEAIRVEHLENFSRCEQPIENIEGDFPPPPERRVVTRGGQEYSMTMPRERRPVEAIKGRPEASRAPPTIDEQDSIFRQILKLTAALSGSWQERLRREWRALPKPFAYGDYSAWLKNALDSECGRADRDAFNATRSDAERLKFMNEVALPWLDRHERDNLDHEPSDDAPTEGEDGP